MLAICQNTLEFEAEAGVNAAGDSFDDEEEEEEEEEDGGPEDVVYIEEGDCWTHKKPYQLKFWSSVIFFFGKYISF